MSASTPSVTRTSTRPTPAAAAISASSGASRTTVAPSAGRVAEQRLVLVVAVDDELVAAKPGRAGERQLAGRGDVGTDSLLPQQAQDGDVREGLRSERDVPARDRFERSDLARVAKRRLAVDDERGAELRGERRRPAPRRA